MGGDNAPQMVVDGLCRVVRDGADPHILLFGRSEQLVALVDRQPELKGRVTVRHAPDVVSSHDRPSVALRSGRHSSMRLAINAVADGEADAVVSAGNTGALMAMAKFVLKTMPGVDRPAIASIIPTTRGRTVFLDLGANIDCNANNLVEFAVMGEVFARIMLGVDKPSVGLLNVGEEDLKGNAVVQLASNLLQNSQLPIRFHGFVEGTDLAAGTVDVVVTDGFTGNVALKAVEGVSRLFTKFLKQALMSSRRSRLGAWLAGPALMEMRRTVDPRRYNGALFLGLNGVCVKSHGGTDAVGFASAVAVAVKLIKDGVVEAIKQDFAMLHAPQMNDVRIVAG